MAQISELLLPDKLPEANTLGRSSGILLAVPSFPSLS
jgi:hypothetical protein